MTKQIIYTYLGTNGTITSPVHLEGIYSIEKYKLSADEGKILTDGKGNYHLTVSIPKDELSLWKEVKYTGQN